MAELADALDSGSSESNFMQVQVLLPAPKQYNPNQIFPVGDGFGLFFISTDTQTPTFRMALSSVPNPNREDPK